MAMATATLSLPSVAKRITKNEISVKFGSFGGLKAQNNVVSLGTSLTADQCFAKMAMSVRATTTAARGNGKGQRGGALASTCNAAGEIFQIAAIMNGLVLVGVAVGFVLLRVEAWLEESEA